LERYGHADFGRYSPGKIGAFQKIRNCSPAAGKRGRPFADGEVDKIPAGRLFILGDLFHSIANKEWFRFEEWRELYPALDCHLITGNHDILHSSFYASANLKTHSVIEESGFRFLHHPQENPAENSFTFCGHIHPGIKLTGRGRQSIQLPCFYQKGNQMILPAFGGFTGLHILDMREAEGLYVIAENKVIALRKI